MFGDVLERVGIEDEEVGALPGRNGSQVVQLQNSRARARRRDDDLRRRHSRGDHPLELVLLGPAVPRAGNAGVAAEA